MLDNGEEQAQGLRQDWQRPLTWLDSGPKGWIKQYYNCFFSSVVINITLDSDHSTIDGAIPKALGTSCHF